MKKQFDNIISLIRTKWCLLFLIAIGTAVRVIGFGSFPGGFNQDEAFAGYEAFSLLNYGVDSAGYHNPCYFVSWGSGMNVLESYLAIPFMKLFGCSVITLRLPQLLLSLISLPVFYLLLKKICSEKTALCGLFLLSVSPWHTMLSRWGLESNLAPALLLIGFYFMVRGITESKYLVFSAVAYGISLYSYSITWMVVPLTLILCGAYLIWTKTKLSVRCFVLSGGILAMLAAPLILFVLVNKNIIPEISTDIFSVPKLLSMRSSEISIRNLILPESYYNLFRILIGQNDGLIWNSTDEFGLFYKISLPFLIIGGVKVFSCTGSAIRMRTFSYEALIALGMLSSVITCLLIENLNVNKANSLHFFTLMLLTVGVREVCVICKNHPVIPRTVFCGYALFFSFFCSFYFGSYNQQISNTFRYDLQSAVEYVKSNALDDVCVDSDVYYSQILFFDQTPHDVFQSTVEYSNYPAAFLRVEKFGRYEFGIDYSDLKADKAYIAKREKKDLFEEKGYLVAEFENYVVAFKDKS